MCVCPFILFWTHVEDGRTQRHSTSCQVEKWGVSPLPFPPPPLTPHNTLALFSARPLFLFLILFLSLFLSLTPSHSLSLFLAPSPNYSTPLFFLHSLLSHLFLSFLPIIFSLSSSLLSPLSSLLIKPCTLSTAAHYEHLHPSPPQTHSHSTSSPSTTLLSISSSPDPIHPQLNSAPLHVSQSRGKPSPRSS